MPEEKKNIMTTDAGHPVGDNQNSLTVGPRGPVVFEDFLLFEKMAHFNRERIPERVVHAKGSGAHGHFVCTSKEITKYTTAKLCSGEKDADVYPVFNGRRREGIGRHRTRPARIRAEVLHGRRQLGYDRQQHTGIFHPRSVEIRRFYSHAEARSGNESEVAYHDVGLLVAFAGIAASGNDSFLRSRHTGWLPSYGRLQQSHVQPDQRKERTVLCEMAL